MELGSEVICEFNESDFSLFPQRGEMRLALEDYQKTTKLQPNKTEAIFKHGFYYFTNECVPVLGGSFLLEASESSQATGREQFSDLCDSMGLL